MTAALSLRPISRREFSVVSHIVVAPEDEIFSGTVREAFEADETDVDFHAILVGDTAVGFFKIDRDYSTTIPLAETAELGLRAFMVDHAQQGQGIATGAVRALASYLARQYSDASSVALTVNMSNLAAIACYLKGGFTDTGEIWAEGDAGPQHFLRMALPSTHAPAC